MMAAPPSTQSSTTPSSLPPPPPTEAGLPHNWRTAKDPAVNYVRDYFRKIDKGDIREILWGGGLKTHVPVYEEGGKLY